MPKIEKVAIANRGEVAVRILQACQELQITSVLLHSVADRGSRAYRMADETVCIGDSPVHESYLSIEKNIEGLLASGADAVHPGFGFLSENPAFAAAVEKAGKIFIGPSAKVIEQLGDKIQAKALIEKGGLPTVPGYTGENQDVDFLSLQAQDIGFPVIVKAAAGGGGRGMKIIENAAHAKEQIESAKREGLSAFGSDKVFLEKYLDRAKHIEVQIFADNAGKAVHLFDRECSVQRRHQKIIEEAVSGSIDGPLRKKLCEAAVKLAKAVGYEGAGTVEFLVQDGEFYFLEMNTRLQVEHPVTELVLGVDLVKAQILAQAGRMAAWDQELLIPRGHSIECRIYAEDPYSQGIPSTGRLGFQHYPEGPGRRFDYAFEDGDEVTSFYDSMIAKVIVWDETRERAILKMLKVLGETVIFGVKTNIPLLEQILLHPDFANGAFTTQFMNQNFPQGAVEPPEDSLEVEFAQKAFRQLTEVPSGHGVSAPNPFFESWGSQ